MRIARLSFVFAAGLVGFACGGETPEPKPPTPEPVATAAATAPAPTTTEVAKGPAAPQKSMAEMQMEAGKGISEAFAAGDSSKFASFYADNATFWMPGAPESHGKAEIEKSMKGFIGAISKTKLAMTRMFTKDEWVIAEWVMTGVHSGDFMGVKATEKPVGWNGASILKFDKQGKIQEEHLYWNMPTLMAQIGAIKGMKARAIPALPAAPEMVAYKPGTNEQAQKDVVNKMTAAFDGRKEADFLGLLADNIEWDDVGAPGPSKGKGSAKKYFKMFTSAFHDSKSEPVNVWVFGDYVVSESKWTANHKGAFMGIPATKKSVTMHGLDVMVVKDGKITKGWSYNNGAELMGQIAPEKMGAKKGDAKKDAKAPAKAAPKK